MLSINTKKSAHEETSVTPHSFDLVTWISARRLQWLVQILRMTPQIMLKQTVFEMFKAPQRGDLLVDSPTSKPHENINTFMHRSLLIQHPVHVLENKNVPSEKAENLIHEHNN